MFSVLRAHEGCTFTTEFRAEDYPLAFVTTAGRPDRHQTTNCSIDIVLTQGKPWRGQVVDVQGAGIADAEVRVMRCEYRSGMLSHWLGEDRDDLITRTDAQGYWTFPRLSPDDSIAIRVRAEGFRDKQERLWPDLIQERKTTLSPVHE